jgi:hypothetical protein
MGLMTGKKALIFGVANERSIAWGITKAFHREGAKIALSYAGEALKDRVTPLAGQVGCASSTVRRGEGRPDRPVFAGPRARSARSTCWSTRSPSPRRRT